MTITGGFHPARRLIDLANTVRQEPDASRDLLAAVLTAHGETPEDLRDLDADDLRAAVTRLTRVLLARDIDEAATLLNAILGDCGARPRLSRHGGHPWHLHVDRGDDAGWGDWLSASSALALAQLLSERGRLAWGECERDGCGVLYLDDGPGSARRYCSAGCANRARVAAHRARRKER